MERFTDYTLGDINQNGSIETALGEVWDWDGDGNSPWDRETGVFDEDDWGNIDSFEDDCPCYSWHTGLPSVNYYVFDANLDDHADIDIDPGDTLEVDGTDIDNNGCIDYMDLNDDGDLDDWITLNETMSIYMGTLTDDEIRDYFDWIQHGTRIFITNTCYGGGFIDDLSSGRTIVMSGSKDISRSSAGFITRLMTQAFGIYSNEADTDGSGRVSIVEAFNHASIHPQTGCALGMDYFQYDDNADALPHEDPLPASGDGYLGSAIFLADALTSAGETSSYALKLNQNHPNPFNPRTTISFILPKTAHATLSIFNAEGKLITSLIDKTLDLGRHEITWNGTDSGNNSVASGIYFYRLLADGKILTRKMVLLK